MINFLLTEVTAVTFCKIPLPSRVSKLKGMYDEEQIFQTCPKIIQF